jgi:hypothetical protein
MLAFFSQLSSLAQFILSRPPLPAQLALFYLLNQTSHLVGQTLLIGPRLCQLSHQTIKHYGTIRLLFHQ